ncbi:hypothetical protein GAG18_12170 [Salmonella enterica]|nr:hypothetical protein [Salmonella enterica]EAX0033820.1 hypothetical protein [Salmonella enterica]EBH9979103.1 hypothetical protein [Salmonella enterica subsp. arizonae serovar 40:z36:-]EDC3687460.1 hypothetical protein [Salmonella enterica]EDZ1187151.1 hypothetical protein [Salmonella enterica]
MSDFMNFDELNVSVRTRPAWRINDEFIFIPDSKDVTVTDKNDGRTVRLTTPAAKCLELLLENSTRIVSQSEFYTFVWGEEGKNVSANTLYQNISIIRRALESLKPGTGKWIETAARKGFFVQEGISAVKFLLDEELNCDYESAKPESFPEIETIQVKEYKEPLFENSRFKKMFLAVTACLAMLIFLVYSFVNEEDNSYMNSFVILKKESGCTFFYNKDSFNTKIPLEISKKIPLDCGKYPFVYITAYEYIRSMSFFACQHKPDTNNPAHCISWYVPSRQS